MHRILAIKIQSFTDLITNSSSELFQLRTDKTVEDVAEKLAEITSGYSQPVYFDLADYRKNIKTYRTEKEKLEQKMGNDNKSWDQYWKELNLLEKQIPNCYIYNVINGWFFDKEDSEHIENAYRNYLCNYNWWKSRKNNLDDLQKRFREFVIENNYIKDPWGNATELNSYYIEDEAFEKFRKTHDEVPLEILEEWTSMDYGNVEDLDGCILVLSENENSISYDDFDLINDIFCGTNYHLG